MPDPALLEQLVLTYALAFIVVRARFQAPLGLFIGLFVALSSMAIVLTQLTARNLMDPPAGQSGVTSRGAFKPPPGRSFPSVAIRFSHRRAVRARR